MNKRKLGYKFEEIAVDYLENQGYEILEKNFYSQSGEIDLIIKKEKRISAVEVKYRKNPLVSIFEIIPHSKIKKIEKTLYFYLSKNNYKDEYDLGIDALLIEDRDSKENIYFIKNIQVDF